MAADRHDAAGVTVVIPTKDRWPLLRTTLASVLSQTRPPARVVVVDDGSADEVARRTADVADRVRVVRHERTRGVSAARNTGLEHVETRWTAFLDDDDLWAPGHLDAVLEVAEREQPTVVVSGLVITTADRRPQSVKRPPRPGDVLRLLHGQNAVGTPSCVVVRTEAVHAVGGFDERLSTLADWDLWLRVLGWRDELRSTGGFTVAYARHPDNMHLDVLRTVREIELLKERHGARGQELGVDLPDPSFSRSIGRGHRAAGRRRLAARWYLRAFALGRRPTDLLRAVGVAVAPHRINLPARRVRETPDLEWLSPFARLDSQPLDRSLSDLQLP